MEVRSKKSSSDKFIDKFFIVFSTLIDVGAGCVMLGAGHVTGVDLDASALDTAQQNLEEFEIDNVDLVNLDVRKVGDVMRDKVEVVLMNPPFGTKHNKGWQEVVFSSEI